MSLRLLRWLRPQSAEAEPADNPSNRLSPIASPPNGETASASDDASRQGIARGSRSLQEDAVAPSASYCEEMRQTGDTPDERAFNDEGNDHSPALASLRKQNEQLKAALESLRRQNSTLKASTQQARESVKTLREKRAAEQLRRQELLERNQQLKHRLTTTRAEAAERREQLLQTLATARERWSATSALWTEARRYFALFRQGLLYDEIAKTDVDFSADTYISLLPSTVPAALQLKREHGGRVICDCVENVEVERHSLAPNMHPPTLEMVNLTAYGALASVDGLMTVSNAVARTLERFGPPVRVQPNFRRYEEPMAAGKLRTMCGVGPDASLLVATGNVVEGFDTFLEGLAQLPETVHLAAFIRLSPSSYAIRMQECIKSMGLSDRVHLFGFVPYAELAGLLSDADLGVIILDPHNPNHSVSLPNRVFDFTTAGLPFVAPPVPEIRGFLEEHGCGIPLEKVTPSDWSTQISKALGDLPTLRSASHEARKKATWESLEDGLIDFLGHPKTVTLLGFRDLSRYQRFLRVAQTLTERGVLVKAVFFSEDPLPVNIPNTEFYHFRDRYGRGPGLERVHTRGQSDCQ